VAGGTTPSDFLEGIAGSGTLTRYLMADKSRIEAFYAGLGAPGIWESTTPPGTAPGCAGLLNCNHFGPLESFTLEEKTFGGYLLGAFEGEAWKANIGLRIVRTENESSAWLVGVPAATPGAINNPFGLIAPRTDEKEYTDVLPSANVSFDLTPDVVLRFAAARVLARPDYAQLAGFTSLTPLLLRGTGGNPQLDPYRANQFDASLEWYFAPQSLLSAALFYKDISTFVIQGATVERQPLETNVAGDPRVTNPANNCVASGPNLFTCDFLIGRPVNASGGHTMGVEIGYQQPIWNGFGVQANYTYTDAEGGTDSTGREVPFPGFSKHILNLSGYYENDRLSARLSYNYRSKYFADYDVERGFRPLFVDATAQWDASASFNLTRQVALTLDVVNITDEVLEEFYDDDKGRPARFYKNGRTLFAGARFRF
jgi:iron complex outermembrane recepter protein